MRIILIAAAMLALGVSGTNAQMKQEPPPGGL
jgi:hypothetical protein